ncbi:MAG: GWxTD domain-containing protein, partial [Bacteroidota bacterium]
RELDEFIKTLRYRSTQQEIDFARALESVDQKKNFLYSFLAKRKSSPEQEVEALWAGHLAALNYVNDQFKSSIRPGWQTDRGRVFLQYGIPNDVERFPAESYSVPYEIWRFNRLGAQSNVVFVFFDPDLATSDYPLLHSNKYGELNQPRWRTMLQNNGRVPTEVDYENNDGRINEKLDLNSSSGGG